MAQLAYISLCYYVSCVGDDGPWLNSHIYHRVIMCRVWVMMGPRR